MRRAHGWIFIGLLGLGAMATPASGKGEPESPQQARAWAALKKEWDHVQKTQQAEVRAHARRIIVALQKGDVEALIPEFAMYNATPEGRKLARKYLEEHRAELQAAAKLVDPDAPDFAKELHFHAPEPEAGMTGQVTIPFGPEAPPPKDKRRSPPRHEIELWWSGPLMPDANGPVHATPPAGSKPGRWRFYALTLPYSHTESLRL